MCQKLTLLFVFAFILSSVNLAQTTYNCTGSFQTHTVPAAFTCVDVVVQGAQGGGTNGGLGARVTGQLSVTPGQVLRVYVGCRPAGTGAGYNGGGIGRSATSAGDPSYGGGGGSDIRVSPYALANRVVVAGGGGGQGGGTEDALGGSGGCATGGTGAAPFGVGGEGGTQTAGGLGGPPWISSGNYGSNGSLGAGGAGATDPCYNNSPGGGGGGGYYGGGGGGSDCYNISPYGGGGGGGGSSLTPTGGTCTAGSKSGHGRVVITPSVCLLPVQFLSFTGTNLGISNQLNWVTATEINNDYFVLQASKTGQDPFVEVGRINGAGNSTTEKEYEFMDLKPLAQLTYYRLKQVDFDGQFSYSNVIALESEELTDVLVYPNPANDNITIAFSNIMEQTTVKLLNPVGQTLTTKIVSGQSKTTIDLKNVAQGIYFIQVETTAGQVYTQKVLKQ
ncbi:MAG: T9SS type A sorting domain-containing protein [Flavobacteriales bacterium]|nr:T9SS type A sorting domain-containing protein [Flavobacteriales bacterium]